MSTAAGAAGSLASKTRKPRAQWLVVLQEALRIGRTRIGLGIFICLVLVAVVGPFVSPYSPYEFVGAPFAKPTATSWLGTDVMGRDVLGRVLWGGRTVLVLSVAATVLGFGLGVPLGMIAGYTRRWFDETVMRVLDVILAIPSIILVLLMVSLVGTRLWLMVLAVGISHAPRIARVTRAATLEMVQRDFVKSSEALGVPRRKVLAFEVLPNITSPLLVEFGLRLTYSISIIASLSFLGLGMQPPAADWGLMINENRIGLGIQPWAVFVPVVLIGLLTVSTNLIADGVGRALIGIERDTGTS